MIHLRKHTLFAFALMAIFARPTHAATTPPSNFFLHDGDTVVFYGDSITEQQMYGRDIENFVVTRFPKMHVKFINSGWSGDKVGGGGGGNIETRLKRDVFPYKPTVVTIFLGMNDGNYSAYNPQIFQTYSTGLIHIVEELQHTLPGVRITFLTPSQFDYDAKTRPAPPEGQPTNYQNPAPIYNDTLIKFGEFVKSYGAAHHIPVADLNAPMVAATLKGRASDPKFALSSDGVHPGEVGHLIMAASVLQTWNAPGTVADITLSPGKPTAIDTPLPWPIPDSARTAFSVSPLPGSLNVYTLHGSDLNDANYALYIDGKSVTTLTREQLTSGVDLSQIATLPTNLQAAAVAKIDQERIDRWHTLFKDKNGIARRDDAPSASEVKALMSIDSWLDESRAKAHDAAQTKPHTYELRPAP